MIRGVLTARDDGARDASRKSLLAILVDYGGDILLVGLSQPLRSTLATRLVHAHVQWTVVQKAEAACRIVELRRRHAEVQQQTVDKVFQAPIADDRRNLGNRCRA